MLGLKENGETAMIENMVDDFTFLIYQYGHIPNGNRTYYLSRSQPPFFSLMVELLASIKGKAVYGKYFTPLQKEYTYWMGKTTDGAGHAIKMPDGSLLSRYYDRDDKPRQESYKEDYDVAESVANELAMRIKMSSPEALKKYWTKQKQLHAEIYVRVQRVAGILAAAGLLVKKILLLFKPLILSRLI